MNTTVVILALPREIVYMKLIFLLKFFRKKNLADCFTKPLNSEKFNKTILNTYNTSEVIIFVFKKPFLRGF